MSATTTAKVKGPLKESPSLLKTAANQAKCLTRRRVMHKDNPYGLKKGQFMNDTGKLHSFDRLLCCSTCEVKSVCRSYDSSFKVDDGVNKNCPLFVVFRKSVLNLLENPLMYLSKKAAALDVQVEKQLMLDR